MHQAPGTYLTQRAALCDTEGTLCDTGKHLPDTRHTEGAPCALCVCVPGPVFSSWSRGHDNRVKCPLIWSRLRVTFLFRLPLPVAICLQGARRLQERTKFKWFSARKRWLTMLTAVQSGQVNVQHVLSNPSSHNFPIKVIFSISSIIILTQLSLTSVKS